MTFQKTSKAVSKKLEARYDKIRSKSDLQVLKIRPWHTTEKHLKPYECMVRELHLMSIIIRRDWTSDDTTNEEDYELDRISKQIKRVANRLNLVFKPKLPVKKVQSKKTQ
jgi:hypothetical protein